MSLPVVAPRNCTTVGMPSDWAASATFFAGSMPRTGMSRAMKCCSRYPSLLATSVTRLSPVRPSVSIIESANRLAWATQESEYDEKYA